MRARQILFLGAIAAAVMSGEGYLLPVSESVPSWASSLQFGSIYLKDILLFAVTGVALVLGLRLEKMQEPGARIIFFSLTIIAGWLMLAACVNEYPQDVLKALRIAWIAPVFYLYWLAAPDEASVLAILRAYLLGAVIGAVINLYFSFRVVADSPRDIMPMLLGQNGPGGAAALFVGVGAFLVLYSRRKLDLAIVLLAILPLTAVVVMSWSKIAQFGFAANVIGLVVALVYWLRNSVSMKWVRPVLRLMSLGLPLLTIWLAWQSISDETISKYTEKVFSENPVDSDNDSDRLAYIFTSAIIVAEDPIFGVSQSGFGPWLRVNDFEKIAEIGDDELRTNPHNSFLFMVTSGGLLCLFLSVLIFAFFLLMLYRVLRPFGRSGFIVASGMGAVYFLYAGTIPILFSADLMFIVAAATARLAAMTAQRDEMPSEESGEMLPV